MGKGKFEGLPGASGSPGRTKTRSAMGTLVQSKDQSGFPPELTMYFENGQSKVQAVAGRVRYKDVRMNTWGVKF